MRCHASCPELGSGTNRIIYHETRIKQNEISSRQLRSAERRTETSFAPIFAVSRPILRETTSRIARKPLSNKDLRRPLIFGRCFTRSAAPVANDGCWRVFRVNHSLSRAMKPPPLERSDPPSVAIFAQPSPTPRRARHCRRQIMGTHHRGLTLRGVKDQISERLWAGLQSAAPSGRG